MTVIDQTEADARDAAALSRRRWLWRRACAMQQFWSSPGAFTTIQMRGLRRPGSHAVLVDGLQSCAMAFRHIKRTCIGLRSRIFCSPIADQVEVMRGSRIVVVRDQRDQAG